MNHAKAAEIAVLGAKRAIDYIRFLNQFRAERLQRAQISLSVALRALIQLHIVNQHFQAAVHAAVIEIEAEPANLQRLAATFVLPRVDAGVELLEHLVIARKQRAIEDLGVTRVHGRFDRFCINDHALAVRGKPAEPQVDDFQCVHGDRQRLGNRLEPWGFRSQAVCARRYGRESKLTLAVRPGSTGDGAADRLQPNDRSRDGFLLRVENAAGHAGLGEGAKRCENRHNCNQLRP